MKKTWLLFDANYLCWRAYHTTGQLSFKSIRTGIVFGYFKAFLDFQSQFFTGRVVHCFDRGKLLRKQDYPDYKKSREKNKDLEEIKLRGEVRGQIQDLRKVYLPEIGQKNILSQKGFEADDIIASVCKNLPQGDSAIIVSADEDLFQLLNAKVSMYSPKRKSLVTEESFYKEWGLVPAEWPMVKALAGCHSDNVLGIRGVGEKTAAKHLKGELKESSKVFMKIKEEFSVVDKNLPIVTIPYPGTQQFVLQEDKIDREGWERVCEKLGLKSIMNLRSLLPFNINASK